MGIREQMVLEREYRLDSIAWALGRDEVWTEDQSKAAIENSEADTDLYLGR